MLDFLAYCGNTRKKLHERLRQLQYQRFLEIIKPLAINVQFIKTLKTLPQYFPISAIDDKFLIEEPFLRSLIEAKAVSNAKLMMRKWQLQLPMSLARAVFGIMDPTVFPSRGFRPHPDEIGGGDLDGDTYIIFWDPDLIPNWEALPADYTAPSVEHIEKVDLHNLQDKHPHFRVQYAKENNLEQISTCHLAHLVTHQPFHKDCTKIAKKGEIALNFSKSGLAAEPLEEQEKPGYWPKFMIKSHEPAFTNSHILSYFHERATSFYYLIQNGQNEALKNRKKQDNLKPVQIIEFDKDLFLQYLYLSNLIRQKRIRWILLFFSKDNLGRFTNGEMLLQKNKAHSNFIKLAFLPDNKILTGINTQNQIINYQSFVVAVPKFWSESFQNCKHILKAISECHEVAIGLRKTSDEFDYFTIMCRGTLEACRKLQSLLTPVIEEDFNISIADMKVRKIQTMVDLL
uniref:RNA-dependent RNA polymerase n=1 Tax=Panagrolaimus sp. PS1159 TaxID=55785 RepID=A0AC35G7G6_9BILA